jgi:hypothetical protein
VTGKATCAKDQGENQNSRKENHCPFEGSVHRSFAPQLNNPEAKKSRCHNYRFNNEPRFLNQAEEIAVQNNH